MRTINESNYHQTADENPKFLIWFYTDWCGFCDGMRSEIEAFEELPVFACNAELSSLLAAKFAVASVPCLILIENGRAVKKAIGDMKRDEIIQFFL